MPELAKHFGSAFPNPFETPRSLTYFVTMPQLRGASLSFSSTCPTMLLSQALPTIPGFRWHNPRLLVRLSLHYIGDRGLGLAAATLIHQKSPWEGGVIFKPRRYESQ